LPSQQPNRWLKVSLAGLGAILLVAVGVVTISASDHGSESTTSAPPQSTTSTSGLTEAQSQTSGTGSSEQSQESGDKAADSSLGLDAPEDEAVALSSIRTGWFGAGPTGDAVDVYIGNVHASLSATQWIGCEGAPAYGDFEIREKTRFTALLAKRDYTPSDIEAQVEILVDGVLLAGYDVVDTPIAVDLALPEGGSTLRLRAIRTAGYCTPAPSGYLVWGNGAVR